MLCAIRFPTWIGTLILKKACSGGLIKTITMTKVNNDNNNSNNNNDNNINSNNSKIMIITIITKILTIMIIIGSKW